ncbi:MAG: bifunctional isocitrate dehydrogenase kinase/phosphatase [Desulfobacteraceae bacterium]
MSNPTIDNKLAIKAYQIIHTGFEDYCEAFATITQRAFIRFKNRNWHGMRNDILERLELYSKIIDETIGLLHTELGAEAHQYALWPEIKAHYTQAFHDQKNAEIAYTFFNSVYRKTFNPVGIDPLITFIDPPPHEILKETADLVFSTPVKDTTPEAIGSILGQYQFGTPFVDLNEDARQCAARIGRVIDATINDEGRIVVEMLKTPFFRGMSAYLVGRVRWSDGQFPIIFALDNDKSGIRVDALLTTQEEMRVLFSFSRAYFHVNTTAPGPVVAFLKELMPEKRIAEIYIGLGYNRHGKTELYRDLLSHQQVCSQDQFDFSPGKHGMVMIAFNMPNDDLIYKLIRDRFDTPKRTTFRQVMGKYEYVFKHDRAGRLLDVQTFENLKSEDCCFTPDLLAEIRAEASNTATVRDGYIILHYSYVERRVTPLDLFLKTAAPKDAEAVVIDYGNAIKDLARINVFPGDMLLKNFGVTRLGRVVFYDYDEICPLLDCNFRKIPKARRYEDELSEEPWFSVGENDVFPEEFSAFLGLSTDLKQIFLDYHGDLLKPEFWRRTQEHLREGTWTHIRPYGKAQMLREKAANS